MGARKRKRKVLRRQPRPGSIVESLWIFDVSKLIPGDVVLESGPGLVSRFIRTADGGKYSHALIYLGRGMFLEAVDIGARLINFMRVPLVDPSAWVVLRHPDALAAHYAAIQAEGLVHKEYGLLAALRSKLPSRSKADPSRLFCSQLVAVAYERAGVTLVQGKESRQITPRLLHENATLKPLRKIPVCYLRSMDGSIPPLDRDAGYTDSVTYREMVPSQKAFRAVKKELGRLSKILNASSTPGDLGELLRFVAKVEAGGAHDEVAPIMKALEEALGQEGYFDVFLPYIREAKASLLRTCEFVKSNTLSASLRDQLARDHDELAAAYEQARTRLVLEARQAKANFGQSRASLWARFEKLNREREQAMHELTWIARAVSWCAVGARSSEEDRQRTPPCPECGVPDTNEMLKRGVDVYFGIPHATFNCHSCQKLAMFPIARITKDLGIRVQCTECEAQRWILPSAWCKTCGKGLTAGWASADHCKLQPYGN